jgi:hypothetical protein
VRFIYPFQVPAVEQTLASRGPAPRENFCASTEETEGSLASGKIREAGVAPERSTVESGGDGGASNAAPNSEDWEL